MKLRTRINKYHKEIRKFQQKEQYNKVKSNQNLQLFHKDINIRNFIYEKTVTMTEKLSAIKKSSLTNKKSSKQQIVNFVGGIGLTAEELILFYIEIYDDIIQTKNIKDLETPHVSSFVPFEVTLNLIFEDLMQLHDNYLTNDKKYSNILKNLYELNNEALIYHIKKTFIISFFKKRDNKEGLTITDRSRVVSILGYAIFQFIIVNTKLGTKLFNLLNLEKDNDDFVDLTEKEFELLKILCTQTNTLIQRQKSLKKTLDKEITPLLKNDATLEFMCIHLKHMFYEFYTQYKNKLTANFDDFDITDDKIKKAKNASRNKFIQIGNFLLEFFIQHDVCELKQTFNNKNNKQDYIKIKNLDISRSFLDYYLFKKPLLTDRHMTKNFLGPKMQKKIREYKKDVRLNTFNFMFNLLLKEHKARIHKNAKIDLTTKKPRSYYKLTPKKKYTIDKNILVIFLQELNNLTKQIPSDIENDFEFIFKYYTEIFNNATINPIIEFSWNKILCLYDLNYERIISLWNKKIYTPTSHYHKSLSCIIYYMITFNSLNFQPYNTFITSKKDFEGYLILKNLINKITQYKISITGIIKEAIKYEPFEFFIADSFLDTRGRLYNKETFLNIQNYPLAKSFVKLYTPLNNFNHAAWKIIQETIPKRFDYNNILNLYSYKDIIMENKKLIQEYLYSFIDESKIAYEPFCLFLMQCHTHTEVLNFCINNAKKKKEIWILFSNILQIYNKFSPNKRKKTSLSVVEMDASSSGLQMISILFGSSELALECNLLYNKPTDAYTKILNILDHTLGHLQNMISSKMLQEIKVFINKDFTRDYMVTVINKFLTSKDNQCSFEIFVLNLCFVFQLNLIISFDLLNTFYILFKKYDIKIPKTKDMEELILLIPTKDLITIHDLLQKNTNIIENDFEDFCNFFLILRIAFTMEFYYQKYSWLARKGAFFTQRDLFKKPIMTFYYNATRRTRIEHFEDLLITAFFENKNETKTDKFPSKAIANILEAFFMMYVRKYMKGFESMTDLTKILLNKNNPITIENDYFNIRLNPKKQQSVQVETKSLNKKNPFLSKIRKQVSINVPTDDLDKIALKRSLSPNIIHSMDATIVHNFNMKIKKINERLRKKEQNFALYHYINHDNFGLTCPILNKILLKECYFDLMQSNYLEKIISLTPGEIKSLLKMPYEDFCKLFLEKKFNDAFVKF